MTGRLAVHQAMVQHCCGLAKHPVRLKFYEEHGKLAHIT